MVKCSTSLWSADLANLAAEIRRVEPFSERFHIDTADGQEVPGLLLFFPDLVKACREHARLPFEVHLLARRPLDFVASFAEAGADLVIFYLRNENDPREVIRAIQAQGKQVGISLKVDEPLELLEPYWPDLDLVAIIGTEIGVKGASMDPSVPDKIRRAKAIIRERGLKTLVQADGGIRRNSVPLMAAAGVDYIMPGSLMFNEDPAEMRAWLAGLGDRSEDDSPSS